MSEPTFKVTVAVCTHRDIKMAVWYNLKDLEGCPDPKISVKSIDGDALISRSRSLAGTWFLEKTEDDYLMFLDDDVVINSFDATKLMWEAYQMKLDVVGAAYVTKSKHKPGLAVRPLSEIKEMYFGKQGKLYPMESVSTGCMIIARPVLKEFIKSGIAPLCVHGNSQYYPFFQHQKMVINGRWEDCSEDWWFCEQAIKRGFKIWCDTTIKTGHIGPYEYTWDDVFENRKELRKTYEDIKFRVESDQEKTEPILAVA